MRYLTILTGWAFLFISSSLFSQKAGELFDESRMHEIRIQFTEQDYWDMMWEDYIDFREFSGDDVPTQLVHVEIDGEQLDSVGIRFKGKSSWYYANDRKKPFRLDFNEYVSGRGYGNLKKLNLHNGMGDPSMIREFLGYEMLRKAGVKAPRVSFTKLYLNDEYWGVYTIVEAVDKPFLEKNFASGDGNLWKNQRWSELEWLGDTITDYNEIFQLKTNEEENDWSKFIELMDVINNTSDAEFPQAIQEIFNVEQYLRVLAIDIMVNNWDSYIDNERNFYLYFEPRTQKFQWIPWDYNLSMGGDLTLAGNPYRSYNETCPLNLDFNFVTDGNQITCTPVSLPVADTYFWEFGDGNFSRFRNPVHNFTEEGIFEVCLTATRDENGATCEQTRCKKIDLSNTPDECKSILDGSCPYPASDPVFQLVIAEDEYCCDDVWDVFCELKYIDFEDQSQPDFDYGVNYNYDYELDFQNPDKVLIHRLLSVPEFKNRYLEHACLIRDRIFNPNHLYPRIDAAAELIRADLFEEPFYLYTRDYFEYNIGDGSGGGGQATIPALKYVLDNRFPQIDEDLNNLNFDCSNLGSPVAYGDVVINEFVASNAEPDGNPDPEGGYSDWIEIFNNTGQTIDMFDFYLSDNKTSPLKWQFPENTILNPFGYLIIWADKNPDQQGIHANFKLSKSGEFLSLVHQDGTLIDSLTFGEQETNIASARIPNGIGAFVKQAPTFGIKNESSVNSTNSFGAPELISVFPNPATGVLNILLPESDAGDDLNFNIENTSGKTVLTKSKKRSNHLQLDLTGIASGVYFLKIESEKSRFIKKVVIEK